MVRINDYYAIKKQLLVAKKEQLKADVENSELLQKYNELKFNLNQQKRAWQYFIDNVAVPAAKKA